VRRAHKFHVIGFGFKENVSLLAALKTRKAELHPETQAPPTGWRSVFLSVYRGRENSDLLTSARSRMDAEWILM
jgi:hypothetical protein